MIGLDHIVQRRLRLLPKIVDAGFLVEIGDQFVQPIQLADIRRDLLRRHPELEIGRTLEREREGDVLAQFGLRVFLVVVGEKLLQRFHRIEMFLGDGVANLLAQRRVGVRIQVGVVSGGIDRGQNGEQRLAAVQLALLRLAAAPARSAGQSKRRRGGR